MKVASILVETLADLGVQHVAGVIGSSVEDIIDALNGHSKVRYLSVRHEQVAASMCEGYAKAAGRPMVCMGHAGPGACNLLIGVASAFRDSTPMLVITGNLGSARLGRDPWHELDVLGLFGPVTKKSIRISDPQILQPTLRTAYELAVGGRPGPVHIDIPQDILAADCPAPIESNGSPPRATKTAPVDDATIAKIASRIHMARRPVFFVGGGVSTPTACQALSRIAHELCVPIVTTETARGVLSDTDPMCLGVVGLYGNPGSNRAIKDADLIIGLACRFSDTTTLGWQSIPNGTSIIHVNIDERELGRQFPVEMGVATDVELLLTSLASTMTPVAPHTGALERAAWVEELQCLREKDRSDFFSKATDDVPLKPQTLVQEVIASIGEDAVLCVGQGNSTASTIRIPVYRPRRYLQSVGLGAMGFAFPGALGAKLACPEQTVVCIAGDGDFAMVMQDLDTAAREHLNVIIIISNNGAYGVNRLGQIARKRTPFGVEFLNPDFAALARMYGLMGYRVETRSQLRATLQAAMTSSQAVLLDVIVDPNERVGQNPKMVGLYT